MSDIHRKARCETTYFYLFGGPEVHADGLDLGDVCADIAVDSRTASTKKNPQLFMLSNLLSSLSKLMRVGVGGRCLAT